MYSMNKVVLMGSVCNIKQTITDSGLEILNFTVITSKKVKENWENEFHNCVIFGKGAEHLKDKVNDKDKLLIEGRIDYSSYNDKETNKKLSSTKIIADKFYILNSAKNISTELGQITKQTASDSNYLDIIPF